MTVIVTMAGAGSRFRTKGYQVPKFMIRARGKTLFEWSMESMRNFFDQHFIFACLNEHDDKWIKECSHNIGISQITLRQRSAVSFGQAQTAYDVLDQADNGEALWICNIDTYIEDGLMPTDIDGYQGCMHVFESYNSGLSFVGYDDNGRVVQVAEKKLISQWATVGVYGFESAALYGELYQKSYQAGCVKEVNGERYVAPMYELLLKAGKQVNGPRLSSTIVHLLGTPEEVLCFDPEASPASGR